MGRFVAAVDVGGTRIKTALLDRLGVAYGVNNIPTHPSDGEPGSADPDEVVDHILSVTAALVDEAPERPASVGIAVPGLVDVDSGTARYSANLGWRDVPMARLLTERTGLPVAFGHDVGLGGLAEARLGAGRGHDRVLFVALGTGLAAAFIATDPNDDTDFDPEIGHRAVPGGDAPCACGNRGCLETVASSRVLVEGYTARTGRGLRAGEVIAAALAGDEAAIAVWAGACAALGSALADAVDHTAADVLVIGGGLALAGDGLLEDLRGVLGQRLAGPLPHVVRAEFADLAGCVGAGLAAWDLSDADPTSGVSQ